MPTLAMTSRPQHEQATTAVIVTAVLTTNIGRVARGLRESLDLINEILMTDHTDWETILYVGDEEFWITKAGPIPNHQLRISVRPSAGFAAINYTDHDDPAMPIANSFNPKCPVPEVDLIFNGSTGSVFPRAAAISIPDTRAALTEWLKTRERPTCIQWQRYDAY